MVKKIELFFLKKFTRDIDEVTKMFPSILDPKIRTTLHPENFTETLCVKKYHCGAGTTLFSRSSHNSC